MTCLLRTLWVNSDNVMANHHTTFEAASLRNTAWGANRDFFCFSQMPDAIGTATHMDRLERMVIQGNQNTSGGAKKRGGVLYYPSTRHFSLPTRNDRGMISYMNSRNGHPQLSSSHHVGPNFHRVWVVVGGGYTDIGLATKSGYNVGGGVSRVCKVCARRTSTRCPPASRRRLRTRVALLAIVVPRPFSRIGP